MARAKPERLVEEIISELRVSSHSSDSFIHFFKINK